MAAQSFKEWFDIVTEIGDQDPFSGFTSKGIAHLGWDAAIKSLEGVQTQTTNSSSMQCTCGYVRTDGKGKIYRVDNEFGKCKVHCIL